MINEHAELRINPGTAEQFLIDFTAARHLLLEAAGCRSAELLRSVDNPDTFLLRVGWEKIEDHTDTFPGTSQAKTLAQIFTSHCVAPPRVIHFEAQDATAEYEGETTLTS